uniref:ARID domain-containing protein n=1 Tax=Eptatretus burgeri TaxID=7764 RepID=A0A8C4QCZ1_EPTBU
MSDFDLFMSHSTSKKVNTRPRSSAITSYDMACYEHESTSTKDMEDNAQSMMGKLVCVEAMQEKRKGPSWFPALVISPDCIDSPTSVRKEQFLVRSFQDGKFHCVSRTDVRIINRNSAPKTDPSIRQALEAGLRFQEYREIPALWRASPAAVQQQSPQRSATTTRAGAAVVEDGGDAQEAGDFLHDESNNDFLLQLFQFMEHRGTPIIKTPVLCYRNLDLFKLYQIVQRCGGCEQVKGGPMWKQVYKELGIPVLNSAASYNIKSTYKRYLYAFELYCQCAGISFGEACKPLKCQEAVADSLGETTEVGYNKHLQQAEDEERAESTSDIEDDVSKSKTQNEGIVEEEPTMRVTSGVRLEPIILSKESGDSSVDQVNKVLNIEGPQVERSLRYLASPECDSDKQCEGREENKAGRVIENADDAKQEKMGEEDEEECEEKKDNEEDVFDRTFNKEESEDLILGTHVHVKYGRGKSLRTYEARIRRRQHEEGDNHYLVHYLGWNSRHDEWIKHDRIVTDVHQRVANFGYGRKGKVKVEDAVQGSTCIHRNRSTGKASRSPIAIFTKCLAKTPVESAPSTACQRRGTAGNKETATQPRGKTEGGEEEEGGYDFGATPTGDVEWSLVEALDTKTHLRTIETGCERDSAVKQMETRQDVKLQEDQDEDWGSIKDEPLAQIHQYSLGKTSAWKDETHNMCQNDITSCTVVTENVVSEEKSLDKSFVDVLQADHAERRLASGDLSLEISEVPSRDFVFDKQREGGLGPSKSGTVEVFQDLEKKFKSPFVLQPESDTIVFPNLGEISDPQEEKALKENDDSSDQMEEDQQLGGTSFIMSSSVGVDDSCNAGQFQEGCQSSNATDCHRPLPGDDIDTRTVSAVKMKAFAALTWVAAERVSDNDALSVCNFPGNMTQSERQTSFSPSSGNGEASPADGEGYQECNLERSERVCRSRYMRHRAVTTSEGANRGPKRQRRSSERTRAKKRRACYKRSRMTSKAGQSSDSEDFSLSEPSHGKLSPPPSPPGSLSSSTDKLASFDVQIELPSLSGAARITWLQQRLQQIRAYYMALRSEVASIDRRLRKFRRRERQALTYSVASLDSHADPISSHAPLALDFG